jgi:hypothetical protein
LGGGGGGRSQFIFFFITFSVEGGCGDISTESQREVGIYQAKAAARESNRKQQQKQRQNLVKKNIEVLQTSTKYLYFQPHIYIVLFSSTAQSRY